MPIYEFSCMNDHHEEHFYHLYQHMVDDYPRSCETCGENSESVIPHSVPLTYFETGRTLVTPHITGEPVEISSFRQHERLMKENNRAPAYFWTQQTREGVE